MTIIHDGSLDIAIGRSRKETSWKNREMLWSDLVKRVSTTHKTAETHSEYLTAKKPRQDEIKDIGGFVGGYLTGGKRKSESIAHRQLVTLDIDHGGSEIANIWEDYALLYGNAAAIYSTHKHSAEAPRYRLLIPLDRKVLPDEYVAIARKIAGMIGIEYFDHTTFEPSRLMYWPSTSKDGEYVFHYQDGDWTSADEILNQYRDWKDLSEWPVSDRNNSIIIRAIKKQGDPLEKVGVIGAFCRTYSIHEAIAAFLSDEYDPCDVENRFTYKQGSTSAGLVVYDDKYAFSHHGTDPASGKLCNAFDLVRLHKFGLKDEDAKEGTPSVKLPSYIAMLDFATRDPKVKIKLGSEMLQGAQGDFSEIPDQEYCEDWLGEMDVDRKGNYLSTIHNIKLILSNDPKLKGAFSLNTFTRKELVMRSVPWRKVTPATRYFTDIDLMGLRNYVEKIYKLSHVQKTADAMGLVLHESSFHPVKEYLDNLEWDETNRVDTLLIDYLGAKDTPYTRAVTRKALVAAVARIYRPGIKFDYVLTLVGKQGIGKSTLIKKLGRDWYCENLTTVQGKEASEQLHGVWLMEMGELAGLKKAEVEIIKNFISRQEDSYRPAYAVKKETYPRQCIFIGTTNNRDFLRDPTGNRRFWPVAIQEEASTRDLYNDFTSDEIDQVWAEAVVLYNNGEKLYLTRELEEMAYEAQSEHTERDDRIGTIQKYLDTPVPENWDSMSVYERRGFLQGDELLAEGVKVREQICIAEIWCELMGGTMKDMTSVNTKGLHQIMQAMPGWKRASNRRFKMYGTQKAYYREANWVEMLREAGKKAVKSDVNGRKKT